MNSAASATEQKIIKDEGLERGVAALTPEKIQKVLDKVLAARPAPGSSCIRKTCVRCGLCSEACHYYLSHDGDPAYSPVGKVKQTMWEILKNRKKITPDFLYRAAQIAYTECNLCRRCAMYCPLASIRPISCKSSGASVTFWGSRPNTSRIPSTAMPQP